MKSMSLCNAHYYKRRLAMENGWPDETWNRPLKARRPNGLVPVGAVMVPPELREKLELYSSLVGKRLVDVAAECLSDWWKLVGFERMGRLRGAAKVESDPWSRTSDGMDSVA